MNNAEIEQANALINKYCPQYKLVIYTTIDGIPVSHEAANAIIDLQKETGRNILDGYIDYNNNNIGLYYRCAEWKRVLLHEIAHALTEGDKHGGNWEAEYKRLVKAELGGSDTQ